MKNISLKFILSALIMLNLFTACKRDEELLEESIISFEDEAMARQESEEVVAITEDAVMKYDNNTAVANSSPLSSACATISRDTTTRTITVDFGQTGCLGPDNRVRKGKILITYTGRYREKNTLITTTFDGYSVNGNMIEGIKKVQNVSEEGQNPKFTVEVSNAKITFTDGTFINWNASRSREWTKGANTPLNLSDDEYTILGTSSGKNRRGMNFTASISTQKPLLVKIACWIQTPRTFHPVSGELTVTPEGKPARVLDYGNGECDKEATVTVNGKTRVIALR